MQTTENGTYQALRTTKHTSHFAIRLGHRTQTLSLTLLRDELSLRLALPAEVVGLRVALCNGKVGLGLLLLRLIVCLRVSRPTESRSLGLGLLSELSTLRCLFLRIQRSIGILLRRLLLNLGLHDFGCTQTLKLHDRLLLLDLGVELRIAKLSLALGVDASNVQLIGDGDLPVGELGICNGLLCLALCFEDSGGGIDLCDFLLRFAEFICLADFTAHAGVCDVDFGLVKRTFVGFAREEGKVLRAGRVLQFLDVGVI
jgi:hypothetical protein